MWNPNLTAPQIERLDLLVEECSEVIKAAQKIKRFGFQSTAPGDFIPNIAQLVAELGDVAAIVTLMGVAEDVELPVIEVCRDSKLDRMRPYVRFQQDIFDKLDAGEKSE